MSTGQMQRSIRNLLSLLASGAFAQVVAFVTSLYLANLLKPADFGVLSFALAALSYAVQLTHFGLPLLATRQVAGHPEMVSAVVNRTVSLRLVMAAFSYCLLMGFSFIVNDDWQTRFLFAIYGVQVFALAASLDWVFQGLEKMTHVGVSRSMQAILNAGLVLLFVSSEHDILFISVFYVISFMAASVFLLVRYRILFSQIVLTCRPYRCLVTLRQSVHMGITGFLVQIIYNIDTVMLGLMNEYSAAGYYNAAYKLIMPMILVSAIYFDVIYPLQAKFFVTSISSLIQLHLFTARVIGLVAMPIGVLGTFYAEWVVRLVYSDAYLPGFEAMQILVWVVVMIYINQIYARLLYACKQEKVFLRTIILQCVVNILLNLLLIPRFGMMGAAVSTLVAELSGFIGYYVAASKVVGVSTWRYQLQALFCAIPMALTVILVKDTLHPLVAMVVAMSVYLGVAFWIRALTTGEVLEWLRMVRTQKI